jgi:hypothetical protein
MRSLRWISDFILQSGLFSSLAASSSSARKQAMSTHGKGATWFRSNADVDGIFLACFRFSLNQVSPPQQPSRIINRRDQRSRHADADLAPAYDRDEMNARASGAGSSTWQIGHPRHRGCLGFAAGVNPSIVTSMLYGSWPTFYCNVVMTKHVWSDAAPTYFVASHPGRSI